VNSNCEKFFLKKSWQEVPFFGGLAVKIKQKNVFYTFFPTLSDLRGRPAGRFLDDMTTPRTLGNPPCSS
jgi:hypothetical protein